MRSRPYDSEADDQAPSVDWRAPPHEVLEAVDNELREHGLEVVLLDAGDDRYRFQVVRRDGEATEIERARRRETRALAQAQDWRAEAEKAGRELEATRKALGDLAQLPGVMDILVKARVAEIRAGAPLTAFEVGVAVDMAMEKARAQA